MSTLLATHSVVKPFTSAVRGEDGNRIPKTREHVTQFGVEHGVLAPRLVRRREDRALAHIVLR